MPSSKKTIISKERKQKLFKLIEKLIMPWGMMELKAGEVIAIELQQKAEDSIEESPGSYLARLAG